MDEHTPFPALRTACARPSAGARRLGIAGALVLGAAGLARADAADPGAEPPETQPSLRAPRGEATVDTSPQGAPPDAVVHYERGRTLYLEGRYGEALVALRAALTFDPSSAELHYNVARLHELLGEIDAAIAAYEAYRRHVAPDDAAELARTDATLKRLRGARNERRPAEPQVVTVIRSAPERGVADAWFWTLGGVGVAALAGAGAAGGAALWLDHRHQDFVLGEDGSTSAYARQGERLRRVALASDGLTIAGSALTLAAVLAYSLRTKPVEPLVSVSAHGGGVWLGLRGRL